MNNIKKRKAALIAAKLSDRGCIITGLRVAHGHNVSKSKRRTNRIYKQNIHKKSLYSNILGCFEHVKLSTRGQRTINKYGGLDSFLLKCKNRNLTLAAKRVKNKLLKKKDKILDEKTIVVNTNSFANPA